MLLVLSYFVFIITSRETRINTRRRTLLPSISLLFLLSISLIDSSSDSERYIYIYTFFRTSFLDRFKIKNGRDIIEAFVTVLSSDKFFPIGPIDRIRHPKVTNYTVNFPYISVQAVHSKREGDAFGDPFRRWRWYVRNCTPDPWQKRQRSAPGPVGIVARSVPPLEMYLAPETMYPEPCIFS